MKVPHLVAATALSLCLGAGCGSTPRPPPASGAAASAEGPLDPRAVLAAMIEVADRALAQREHDEAWQRGAFIALLPELADLAGEARYLAAVRALGESTQWKAESDQAPTAPLALPYVTLYQRDRDRRTVAPTLSALDRLCGAGAAAEGAMPEAAAAAAPERLLTVAALAVATPATARPRYLACADRWLPKLLPEAQSDGWALVALARLVESLPDGDPRRESDRQLFRAQLAALVGRPAPARDPLVAALLTHALAAGLNRGLLAPAEHEEAARQAWVALVQGPRLPGAEFAAAFLLAGTEIFHLTLRAGSGAVALVATNPLAESRFIETAETAWPPLARALGAGPGDPVVVTEARSGRLLLSQLLDEDGDGAPDRLLVSLSLLGNEARRLEVRRLARPFRPPRPPVRASGRFVPEARDDFAWENDRVAFRVYGPALEPQHLSSGIDVWAKRVREPVIDRWYQRDDYHRDRGEGLDFYNVGPSRGCGGLGLWDGRQLYTSRNFRRWRVLADGPVRVAFQLDYGAWGPPQSRVTESKRISLDLGQNLSRIATRFATAGPPRPLPVAVGVVRRGEGTVARDEPTTWMSYVEPPQGNSGQIGCGIVGPESVRFVESEQHYLLVRDHPSDRPFIYYAGAYWSKGPDFREPDDWGLYLAAFSRRAGAPIRMTAAER